MSTLPTITDTLPTDPTIPLTPELRAAYEDLYGKYETAIEATRDPGVHASLLSSQNNVDNVLTKDDLYRLEANTVLYEALATQIKDTNTELKTLQAQILAISSGVSKFGDILAAITKVLSMVS